MLTTESQRTRREMFFIRSGDDDRIERPRPFGKNVANWMNGLDTERMFVLRDRMLSIWRASPRQIESISPWSLCLW